MRLSVLRFVSAVAVGALAVGLFAEDASARRRRRRRFDARLARAPLIMTAFVQAGRTDVRRNEALTFKFSAYVRRASVDNRSVRIGAVTNSGLREATGAIFSRGARVVFDPTRTQGNYVAAQRRNSLAVEKDHPQGFDAFQDYTIHLPGPPELRVLTNFRRQRILSEFTGTFRTNGKYDDPVPGQPSFVGEFANGQLGFSPPRSGATGEVDEDAIVIFEFSEPIDINSLDPASSLVVERQGAANAELVPGLVRVDPNEPSGRRFLFIPSLGFGTNEAQQSGWDIRVTLTTGVTDLAGNSLKRPVVFPLFRTRFVAGKPSSSVFSESFEDQLRMDGITPLEGGEWNTLEEGFLLGGAATTYQPVDVQYTAASTGAGVVRTRVAEPLVAATVPPGNQVACGTPKLQGSRVQSLFIPGDVGPEAAITGMGWGPDSNAIFAAEYPGLELTLGHTSATSLGVEWNANVNFGNPQVVFNGDYSVPQAANINPPGLSTGYWDWPTFSSPFEWNGVNNLVFDQKVPGGTNCQVLRIAFITSAFSNRRAVSRDVNSPTANFGLGADKVVYDTRFRKRRRTTRATSQFFQLPENPIFTEPIVSPPGQPGGVEVRLELEGAQGRPDPFNEGEFIADTSTATGWRSTPSEVDGSLFLRFRIIMIANLTTNQTARVASVQIPFEF